jgi:hypothetical protein
LLPIAVQPSNPCSKAKVIDCGIFSRLQLADISSTNPKLQ